MKSWLAGLYRTFLAAATAIGVIFLTVTLLPVLGPWTAALSAPWNQGGGQTLIILGGDEIGHGIIGVNTYWRLANAILEWRTGAYKEIVVCGGGGLAEAMRDFLTGEGVPLKTIRMENQSSSTRENALFTARLLRDAPGRKVLLTSDYHSLRAWRAFQKCGLAVTPLPVPDASKRIHSPFMRWDVFLQLAGETVKLAGYRLRGWI